MWDVVWMILGAVGIGIFFLVGGFIVWIVFRDFFS